MVEKIPTIDPSQEQCVVLRKSISTLLEKLATDEQKRAFSFLTESCFNESECQNLKQLLTWKESLSALKKSFLTLSNRLLRLVLVRAGTLPASESLEQSAQEAQKNIKQAILIFNSTQLEALSKKFLEKHIQLEKEIIIVTEKIQTWEKDPEELAIPEKLHQKIVDAFLSLTQDQKKLEEQSQTITEIASKLLEHQRATLYQLFSTADKSKDWFVFDHSLEQLQRFQKMEELFADLASSLIQEAFLQGQLIGEVKKQTPDIIVAIRQQGAAIGSDELTDLMNQFLLTIPSVTKARLQLKI